MAFAVSASIASPGSQRPSRYAWGRPARARRTLAPERPFLRHLDDLSDGHLVQGLPACRDVTTLPVPAVREHVGGELLERRQTSSVYLLEGFNQFILHDALCPVGAERLADAPRREAPAAKRAKRWGLTSSAPPSSQSRL